ncbi:hypothetical protein HKD37_01G001457 [Glycine soja]
MAKFSLPGITHLFFVGRKMWRQVKATSQDESIGRRRNINPVHVAFIVDKYLCDNNFSSTRSIFRNEASSLFATSSINQLPKTLEEMLDEYIFLKKQNAILNQERVMVMEEKNRIQILLQGMQNALNTYNAFQRPPSLNVAGMNANFAVVPQPRVYNKTPQGVSTITSISAAMQNTSNTQLLTRTVNTNVDTGNFSTPMISVSDKKRKDTEAVNGPIVAKKPRGRPPGRKNQVQGENTSPQSSNAVNNQVVSWPSSSATQSSSGNCAPSGSLVQGSNAVKGSFNHPPLFVPDNSPIPKTPTTQSSQSDTYVSPTKIYPAASCNGEASPTCCTMNPTNKVMVGPETQMAYKENSHCNSPIEVDTGKSSKKDDVRSKLNFDASNMPESLDKSLSNEVYTSESDKEVDISDIDFSNLMDCCPFLGITSEDFSYHPVPTHSKDNASTPVHVALIVYQYLNDNNFSQMRSTFRNEASSLFSDSLINEASKSWMSLGQILDDYMCLKVQKVMLDEQQVEAYKRLWMFTILFRSHPHPRQVKATSQDESIGRRRNINPVHVAFIVDKYLCDNHFSNTRCIFRNEASSLFATSSINQLPKTLEEMLNEYIFLKKQNVVLNQERVMVMEEKNRIQILLQGMQNALNTYNAFQRSPSLNVAGMNANFAVVPQPRVYNKTPQGVSTITSIAAAMQNTSNTQLLTRPVNTNVDTGNFSTPMISVSDKKRKDTEAVNGPIVAKKPRGRPPGRKNQVQGENTSPQSSNAVNNQVVSWPSSSATQSSSGNCAPSGSLVQGSNAVKGSFNHPPLFVPDNSPIPKTPTTQSSQSDTYVSPTKIYPAASCNGEASPTCCTMNPTNKVMVGPETQMAYKENSHCNSPIEVDTGKSSKKDDVRSKLNFDASNMPESLDKSLSNEVYTSESDKEVDISDIDFSNLMDCCPFLGITSEDFSYHPVPTHYKDNASTLGQILDEYMCLKEQKVMLDEQVEVTQEKTGFSCLGKAYKRLWMFTILFRSHPHQRSQRNKPQTQVDVPCTCTTKDVSSNVLRQRSQAVKPLILCEWGYKRILRREREKSKVFSDCVVLNSLTREKGDTKEFRQLVLCSFGKGRRETQKEFRWLTNQPNTAKSFGMGKISPVHVVLIVNQYLNDNNFSQTHSTFCNEASSLFFDSLINELGQILDDYMCLKEQKMMLDEQRVEVTQDKNQIHMLRQGIQKAMDVYNTFQKPPSPKKIQDEVLRRILN